MASLDEARMKATPPAVRLRGLALALERYMDLCREHGQPALEEVFQQAASAMRTGADLIESEGPPRGGHRGRRLRRHRRMVQWCCCFPHVAGLMT